ncbi:tetratricopeptide repeat protein [Paraburkholderia sp. DHOC27]|uniref:tetratricopeptide repeat protein n=1 Tax=Paraburkholderia sp. DHOC27 TaxID=2303330 RepID=UPI000E3C81A3|nr:tetratricopeptide repeat protein [Paraburkholderia sp. DHOC27]RFU49506.1 tetratricopeptide repeat protein [Paraburkholderia sp. DHOC27]
MTSASTLAPSGADQLERKERLQTAVSLCQGGKFAEALALLQPELQPELQAEPHTGSNVVDAGDAGPEDLAAAEARIEALNIAAVCALGLKQAEAAETWWRQSIAEQPAFIDAYNNLGIMLKALGRLSEAEELFRSVTRIQPDEAQAFNNLGAVLYALKRPQDAEQAYRQALALRPDYAEAHYNLGIVLYDDRRFAAAETAYRDSLAARPKCAEAHNNLGNALKELGRLAEAEQAYRQALLVRAQYPEALNNLAGVLKTSKRLPEAELACRLALAVRANYPEAHNNLGGVLGDLKRLPEAEACYRQALALRPGYAEAHYNLGIVLQNMDRLPEAEAAYRDALRCNPNAVEALNNLGNVLHALDRLPEAATAYREALAMRPSLAEAQYNLGHVLKGLKRLPEAEAAYRQALVLREGYAEANFALAILLISMGQFDEGWRRYEQRNQMPAFIHGKTEALLPIPKWQGESLAGKTLLIWQEDGLGDMLQFGRFIGHLQTFGIKRVAVVCMSALRRVFTALDGVDVVLDHAAGLVDAPGYDYWVSLISLPLRTSTTLETIPPACYLRAEPSLMDHWRPRLAALPAGRRIGVVWKGNARHHNDANRSLPSLAALAPLWSVPELVFVSLQKGQGEDEAQRPPAGQPLLHLGSDVNDMADSAAIVAQLDLVICVDTSIAHLAGSLGKPCWVLLPAEDIDWRWMHDRTDTPWYPQTMRLFRQTPGEGWGAVIERVREACVESFAESLDAQAS